MTPGEAAARLRLVDVETGESHGTCPHCAEREAESERLRGDLENIEKELRRLRAANSRLQGEVHRKLELDPRYADAAAVYAEFHKHFPRSKAKPPGDRIRLLLGHLEHFSVDELSKVPKGAAERPIVGRRGDKLQKFEFIFRDTGMIEEHIARADLVDAPAVAAKPAAAVFVRQAPAGAPDVRALFAELGVQLPGWEGRNVPVSCFADPGAHSREDRNKSCSVSTETGAWMCHGCGASGGAYDAALALGRRPREAMELLERHGLVGATETGVRQIGPSGLDAKEQAVAAARRALAANRGMLDRLQQLRGWSPQAVVSLGLGVAEDRVLFPIRDGQGRLVGVNRYAPNPAKRSGPKMLADQGSRRDLFPAPETLSAREVWLVEGEADSVAARTLGLSATGVPGVQGWRSEWAGRFKGRSVATLMDCDPQGRECAERITADLRAAGVEVVSVDLAPGRTDGYDLGDLVAGLPAGPAGARRGADTLVRLRGRAA